MRKDGEMVNEMPFEGVKEGFDYITLMNKIVDFCETLTEEEIDRLMEIDTPRTNKDFFQVCLYSYRNPAVKSTFDEMVERGCAERTDYANESGAYDQVMYGGIVFQYVKDSAIEETRKALEEEINNEPESL